MLPYTIRTSTKSRNVNLKVSRTSGLEVIIPFGFDETKIPEIIAKKEQWIKRAMEKVQQIKSTTIAAVEIPNQIIFQSNGVTFGVVVEHHSNRENYLTEENNTLKLSINPQYKKVAYTLLKQWLQKKAQIILLPWFDRVSKEHGFTYTKATIRFQKTKWGSCSHQNNISLNRTLVFLRPEVVEYLFLHELCHTAEKNHSGKFWALVEKHCPNYRELDKQLKGANKSLEGWVY
ncbi:MAG: M48 family metallopeptidase [Bacteroidetes bacterium]|nr:M48 family metallopeptidase [Bacteroidota bacterium]